MSTYTCQIIPDPSIKCTSTAHMKLWVEAEKHWFIAEMTDDNLDFVEGRYGKEARHVVVAALRDTLAKPHPFMSFDEGLVARYHPENDWSRQAMRGALNAVHGAAA